jgi:hypothetical protein
MVLRGSVVTMEVRKRGGRTKGEKGEEERRKRTKWMSSSKGEKQLQQRKRRSSHPFPWMLASLTGGLEAFVF